MALLVGALALGPKPSGAQETMTRERVEAIVGDYIKAHPDEIGEMAKQFVLRHPEVLREILVELNRQKAAQQPDPLAAQRAARIAAQSQAIFHSPHQAAVGARDGDVILVEFFDYNCGYCKRALGDTVALLAADPHLTLVLKDLPILGPRSVDAAQVAIAARMQDAQGDRYFAFHRQLLGASGPVTQDAALAAARDNGFDMERLQADMASAEVAAALKEDFELAQALQIRGTPAFIAGDRVLVGAIGLDALKAQVARLRERAAKGQ